MSKLTRKIRGALERLPHVRMADWMLAAIILFGVVAWMAPQQLGVTVYKMALVALAALAGYWIDRSVFPYAKPDQLCARLPGADDIEHGTAFTDIKDAIQFMEAEATADAIHASMARTALLRRAIIIAATILGVSLGA